VLVALAVDVALILHVAADAGAVKRPVVLMVPHEVDHITAWFAVNCI
jgi:hypothetical protein